jgi:fumarate reductase subunit C
VATHQQSSTTVRLYLAQRISALVMAPLVLVHLVVIVYAIRNGLDAAEILSRTRGSLLWGTVYGLFVVAVSVHAAIGLRTIVHEWLKVDGTALQVFTWIVGSGLLLLGGRAVIAVVA